MRRKLPALAARAMGFENLVAVDLRRMVFFLQSSDDIVLVVGFLDLVVSLMEQRQTSHEISSGEDCSSRRDQTAVIPFLANGSGWSAAG